jgi:hypothetical protein
MDMAVQVAVDPVVAKSEFAKPVTDSLNTNV